MDMTNTRRTKTEIRTNHNRELLKRMEAGESLSSFDSQSSWFPPRPVLEKDQEAVKRLYGNASTTNRVPESVLDLAVKIAPVKTETKRKPKVS